MKKNIIKTVLFLAFAVVLLLGLQKVLNVSNHFSEHTEMVFDGYYSEPENTVDAVLIGNSHIYKFWQSPYAWRQNGLATLPLSTSDMPASIVKNMAIEALKTQKPKVLVIDATEFAAAEAEENNKIFLVLNNMKFSRNYMDMIDNYCDYAGITGMDRMKYYFPILQFHSRWNDLRARDFVATYPSYLNACYLPDFLEDTIEDRPHTATEKRLPIAEKSEAVLRDLLEWCTKQECEVLFIASPVFLEEERLQMFNYVGDIIKEYGIDFINYNDPGAFEQFGFNVAVDYQDKSHTNVNGSWKFTQVLGQYLIDEYGLTDHRGEEAYASWETRAQSYFDRIKEYFIY